VARSIRDIRDQIIRYVYENGAGEWEFAVDAAQVQSELGVSDDEFQKACMLLATQDLLGGYIGAIGLNEAGQREAEAIGPTTSFRAEARPQSVTVNAQYSVVQIAGSGSTQTGAVHIDRGALQALIDEVTRELPKLDMSEAARAEASDLAEALKNTEGMRPAAVRATAAALSGILTAAGSALGKRILELLGALGG
jgi:hypothetical protein